MSWFYVGYRKLLAYEVALLSVASVLGKGGVWQTRTTECKKPVHHAWEK